MLRPVAMPVEILILGAGWTSTFLIPLLRATNTSFAATTRNGHDDTIPFTFDPDSDSLEPYRALPQATTVVITFPLTGQNQSRHLTSLYRKAHGADPHWIQLGSTGAFVAEHWNDAKSAVDTHNARVVAEQELIDVAKGCVLHLAGLYGGQRDPRSWVQRVAKTKDEVRAKKGLHLIHGEDVARGILAAHKHFTPAKRWLLTDLHVYDWWDLVQTWGKALETPDKPDGPRYTEWVGELMVEHGVRALPRAPETLGRILDSRDFWATVGVWPTQGRVK